MKRVNCVFNVHREDPLILVPSARCLASVVGAAREAQLDARISLVLDCASENQKSALDETIGSSRIPFSVIEVEYGDAGLARNAGTRALESDFVSFFDADDLWARSWLIEAFDSWTRIADSAPHVIVNSEFNVVFAGSHIIEVSRNLASATPLEPNAYALSNYSTSQIFTSRQTVLDIPFPSKSGTDGFGHEDWEWSKLLSSNGGRRSTADGTWHMIRRELGAQSLSGSMNGWLPRPLRLLLLAQDQSDSVRSSDDKSWS